MPSPSSSQIAESGVRRHGVRARLPDGIALKSRAKFDVAFLPRIDR